MRGTGQATVPLARRGYRITAAIGALIPRHGQVPVAWVRQQAGDTGSQLSRRPACPLLLASPAWVLPAPERAGL